MRQRDQTGVSRENARRAKHSTQVPFVVTTRGAFYLMLAQPISLGFFLFPFFVFSFSKIIVQHFYIHDQHFLIYFFNIYQIFVQHFFKYLFGFLFSSPLFVFLLFVFVFSLHFRICQKHFLISDQHILYIPSTL